MSSRTAVSGIGSDECSVHVGGGIPRWVDAIAAVAAGIALLPLVLLLAGLVRLCIKRPVLFVQERAGLNGCGFRMVKFRTMTDGRDSSGELLPDDDRVTRLGRLMRRTRLDELPELWNVVRGDMGFVGPRPLLPATISAFGLAGRTRSAVRPGLTGWAQVNGNTLLSNEDKLALDLWYVDHRSVRLDLLILLRTISVVVEGERVVITELAKARAHARDRHRRG